MQVLTLTELMRLTRIELALAARITTELAKLPEDSPDRNNALINLSNIRVVLARRDLSPRKARTPQRSHFGAVEPRQRRSWRCGSRACPRS